MDVGPVVVGGNAMLTLSTLNSAPALELFKIVSPAVHFSVGHVAEIPEPTTLPDVLPGIEMVEVAKADWDSFETSWGFQMLPVIQLDVPTVGQAQIAADTQCQAPFQRINELYQQT